MSANGRLFESPAVCAFSAHTGFTPFLWAPSSIHPPEEADLNDMSADGRLFESPAVCVLSAHTGLVQVPRITSSIHPPEEAVFYAFNPTEIDFMTLSEHPPWF